MAVPLPAAVDDVRAGGGRAGILLVISQIIGNTADGGLTNVGIGEAVIFYWICWILAIPLTKVVLLPLFSLTYLESAGEIRRIEWSIPESQVPLPVLASAPRPARPRPRGARGVGRARQASPAAAQSFGCSPRAFAGGPGSCG